MSYVIKPAMSISYVKDISDGRGLGIFFKLITRWKGSVYKLVWIDLTIFLTAYFTINLIYRFALNENMKAIFHSIVEYCQEMKRDIPISFLIGFFVSGVIGRWYMMYMNIPWLSKSGFVVMSVVGNRNDERCREFKLTIVRYMNLAWVLTMRRISDQIRSRFLTEKEKKRFGREPTKAYSPLGEGNPLNVPEEYENENETPSDEKVALGDILRGLNNDPKVQNTFGKLITENEIQAFQKLANDCLKKNRESYIPEYWVPLNWAARLVQIGIRHKMFSDIKVAIFLIDEINKVRQQMADLQIFTSIMLPLVYAQVVIIAVAAYFICLLFSSQFTEQKGSRDLYFPFFMILSFLFIDGWLKVALCILNPFGDDDEDFQTNDILDYNLEYCYRIAYGEESHYPSGLTSDEENKFVDPINDDGFNKFLDDTSRETQKNMAPVPSTKNLEIPMGKGMKISNICQC